MSDKKHWFHEGLPELNIEREMKRLEEAKKKEAKIKKAEKERLDNIKYCWIEGKAVLSDLDISWLITKAEKGIE